MRSNHLPFIASLVFTSVALAQPAPAQSAQETWETVFARDREGRDHQIGYVHVTLEPVGSGEKKVIRGTREMRINIKRGGQMAQLKADTGTDETEDGKVVGVFMRHWIGEKQALTMQGKLDETGKFMALSVESTVKNEFKQPWDAKVIGLGGEQSLLRDKKVSPGDKFSYRFFEPTVSSVVTVRVSVGDEEEVVLPRGGKKKMLRVESRPDKIQEVQLPSTIIWADPKTLEPLMSQTEMPDLGLLTLLRSTKAAATGPLGDVPDLMKLQTIRLGQRINADVHALQGVVYRITVNGKDVDPAKVIKQDDRQSIKNLHDRSFELHVDARRSPRSLDKEAEPAAEFIKSNYFINSDDENVKKLAATAVGNLKDKWEKARAIEAWVRANMKSVDYTEAMATADHVAKTLSGDCSEYSMLAAAMCRAQGIPSRTAIGLVYVDSKAFGGPALAFHMWTEVYIKGQWLAIDATLGKGSVGPGHIKITDHSWHETRDFKPLLPVTGFIMAKPTVEILSATRE
jgi:hypothetical protein